MNKGMEFSINTLTIKRLYKPKEVAILSISIGFAYLLIKSG
jgi:hypothetical protein